MTCSAHSQSFKIHTLAGACMFYQLSKQQQPTAKKMNM